VERVPLRHHVPVHPGHPAGYGRVPNFASQCTTDYGAQAAAAVVVTVPLVILVLIFQRRIVSGLTAGAVKG
jgi:ABC-type glycerol-3-phosphate transport system permease component